MERSLSPKYAGALSGAAVLILFIGVLLKPAKKVAAPQPSETASLQRLVREQEVRSTLSYLGERATAAAQTVVFLPHQNRTAVAWGTGEVVVSAPAEPNSQAPLEPISYSPPLPVAAVEISPPAAQEILLVVAGNNEIRSLWDTAMYHGQQDAPCGSRNYRELVIETPADPRFDGAGIFTLDGRLLGIVGRCAGKRMIVASSSVADAIASWRSPENQLIVRYGFSVSPLDEAERKYFQADDGLLVRSVWNGSPAGRGGLRPGDIVSGPFEVAGETLTLDVRRNGRPTQITLTIVPPQEPPSGLGFQPEDSPPVAPTVRVAPDGPADRAGIRTGDRILQIDRRTALTPTQMRRALAAIRAPAFVVYERGPKQTGVLVSP